MCPFFVIPDSPRGRSGAQATGRAALDPGFTLRFGRDDEWFGSGEPELALTDRGLPETEASVQVKINRGTFPAWFMLAVMRAVGAHTLHLE